MMEMTFESSFRAMRKAWKRDEISHSVGSGDRSHGAEKGSGSAVRPELR
jgi:hypothetical protein